MAELIAPLGRCDFTAGPPVDACPGCRRRPVARGCAHDTWAVYWGRAFQLKRYKPGSVTRMWQSSGWAGEQIAVRPLLASALMQEQFRLEQEVLDRPAVAATRRADPPRRADGGVGGARQGRAQAAGRPLHALPALRPCRDGRSDLADRRPPAGRGPGAVRQERRCARRDRRHAGRPRRRTHTRSIGASAARRLARGPRLAGSAGGSRPARERQPHPAPHRPPSSSAILTAPLHPPRNTGDRARPLGYGLVDAPDLVRRISRGTPW